MCPLDMSLGVLERWVRANLICWCKWVSFAAAGRVPRQRQDRALARPLVTTPSCLLTLEGRVSVHRLPASNLLTCSQRPTNFSWKKTLGKKNFGPKRHTSSCQPILFSPAYFMYVNLLHNSGSCHKRQKPQAPTSQALIRNHQTREVANAKGLNRNTNLT